jgi:hypothetical protein
MTEFQKMPAKQAVVFGSEQFLNSPNYAFSMATRLDGFEMKDADSTLGSEAGSLPFSISMQGLNNTVNRLAKRMTSEVSGVIDSPNGLYEFTPVWKYNSKNLNLDIRTPVAYSNKQKALFVDFSAFDGLLANPANEGKYSRFDLSKLPIHDKGPQLTAAIAKSTSRTIESLNSTSLVDLPLTDDDKKSHIARKVQVTTSYAENQKYMPELVVDLVNVFAPELTKKTGESSPLNVTDMRKALEETNKIIAPSSSVVSVVSYDKNGSMLRYEEKLNLAMGDFETKNTPIPKFSVQTTTTMNISNIGTATLANAPTAENSVDGIENAKGSLLGKFFVDAFQADKEVIVDKTPKGKPSKYGTKHAAADAARATVDAAKAPY